MQIHEGHEETRRTCPSFRRKPEFKIFVVPVFLCVTRLTQPRAIVQSWRQVLLIVAADFVIPAKAGIQAGANCSGVPKLDFHRAVISAG